MDIRSRVVIALGDVVRFRGDAVVNAANTQLLLGVGVAGAIRKAGGPTIQAECDALGPIPLGEAAVTNAGELPCRFVVHAATMHPGGGADARSLRLAVTNSLRRCAERGFASVAFPALGMGIAGFPVEEGAPVFLSALVEFLSRSAAPAEVHILLNSDHYFRVFSEAWERHPAAAPAPPEREGARTP